MYRTVGFPEIKINTRDLQPKTKSIICNGNIQCNLHALLTEIWPLVQKL